MHATQAGIKDIIIDPGFGFGKTIEDNFALIKEMEALQILRKPLLLGVSRKSSIYQTLKITPEESLNGTTVLNTVGLMNKAMILRVHDVKEAAQAIQLYQHLQ
jgi:dihydropteroate synthase